MALERLTKQPAESRLFDFDFAGKMATGETVTGVSGVVATPVGLTVGATSFSGALAQVRLSGGTTLTEYLLTCTVTTSLSNTLELDGLLWVENVTAFSLLEQAALDQLIIMVQADTCPELDYSTYHSELRAILRNHKRGVVWVTDTAFNIGDVVIPTAANRNGHRYKLVEFTSTGTDQKSGATEPSWSTTRDSQITDDVVVWREDGYDWDGMLWDLTAAANEAWLAKAAKASVAVDNQRGEVSKKSSQLYDHCVGMAAKYQPAYCL